MYVPEPFAERELPVLHGWLRRYPFALLVTAAGGELAATHLPFWLDPARGPRGTLYGHVAKANPHWRSFDGSVRALAVFSGPHAYVSPRWYESAGVPTWNYVAVHAEGAPRRIEDGEEVERLLQRLTETYEGEGGYAALPQDLVARMVRGIVAFELPIERLTGKAQLSQNKGAGDRAGVIRGLEAQAEPQARELAALLRAEEAGGRA
jgi:transcriptional regulator